MGFSPANLLFFLWAMTASVSGVVVDEAGRPVAGAEVRISSSFAVRTSPEGRFRVERVPTGRTFELAVVRPGFAPSLRTGFTPKPGAVPPLRITLRRGRTVSGTVKDGEGKPAAGVEVELARSRAVSISETAPPDRGLHQTVTGSDGRFTLPDLPAGRFDLAALGPGFRSPLAQALPVVPGTEPLDLGTFTLERKALEGRVRDPEGRPVAGAEVWVRSKDWAREWWDVDFESERPAAVTGADGRFEIPDLPSRGWEGLLVCRKGFTEAFAAFPAGEPVEAVLVPRIPISGKVLDLRGEPVAGAMVSAWLSGGGVGDVIYPNGPCLPDPPRTDAEGRFSLDLEEPGWYDVSAEAEGYLLAVREVVRVPSGEEVVLTLEAGAPDEEGGPPPRVPREIRGRVLGPDGEPVEGALVSTVLGDRTTTDADGSFLLFAQDEGDPAVRAEKEGYGAGFTGPLQPPVSGVEIRLTQGLSLTGRLLGLEPEELARAAVRAAVSGAPERWAALDPDGRYQILDLPPGEWTVTATAGPRAVEETVTLSPDAWESVHDLVFRPTWEVWGRAISESGPLAGVEIGFFKDGQAPAWIESGEDGTFSVRLEDGEYSALASVEGYFGSEEERTVTVAGAPIGVDFELHKGATVTGRILGLEPGRGRASLKASLQGGEVAHSGEVDQDGSYRITGLSPGVWELEIYFPLNPAPRSLQGQIAISAGMTEMTLDLELGEPIHFHRIPLRNSPEEP